MSGKVSGQLLSDDFRRSFDAPRGLYIDEHRPTVIFD